jgi:hypothetical protein
LVVVRPETMIRWHRAGWKLFWRLKSRPGRPPIPQPLQALKTAGLRNYSVFPPRQLRVSPLRGYPQFYTVSHLILPTTNCQHKNVVRVALSPEPKRTGEGECTCEIDCR